MIKTKDCAFDIPPPTEVIRASLDASSYTVNGVENPVDYCIFYAVEGNEETKYYIALDYVKKYAAFPMKYLRIPTVCRFTPAGRRSRQRI